MLTNLNLLCGIPTQRQTFTKSSHRYKHTVRHLLTLTLIVSIIEPQNAYGRGEYEVFLETLVSPLSLLLLSLLLLSCCCCCRCCRGITTILVSRFPLRNRTEFCELDQFPQKVAYANGPICYGPKRARHDVLCCVQLRPFCMLTNTPSHAARPQFTELKRVIRNVSFLEVRSLVSIYALQYLPLLQRRKSGGSI